VLRKLIKDINSKYLKLLEVNPVNNVYGLARTILATGTFLTLIANSTETLFMVSSELEGVGISKLVDYSLFNLLSNHLGIAKIFSVAVLFFVIIGIYPRFTGLLHWYISFSFFSACSVIDGGDQANSVLALLLVPVTLMDNRKWHWQQSNDECVNISYNSTAWAFICLLRIQVSAIYLHAAVAKFKIDEWVNGTAIYYWFMHHYHGAADYLKPFVIIIVSNNFLVVLISWGTIVLELLLFSAILLGPKSLRRRLLLLLGLTFHFLIVVIHGLISFYFTMAAALLLYLSDYTTVYNFSKPKLSFLWNRY